MNIEYRKIEKGVNFEECWQADCKDCPGTPPVGYGKTREEALAALFYLMMFSNTGGSNPSNWLKYIERGEPIVIDGKIWEDPNKNKR